MEHSLERLLRRMPPPEGARKIDFGWAALEEQLGFEYPRSFKNFMSYYWRTLWFKSTYPYVPGQNANFQIDPAEEMADVIGWAKGNLYDPISKTMLDLPLYPATGGLIPFVTSDGGGHSNAGCPTMLIPPSGLCVRIRDMTSCSSLSQ